MTRESINRYIFCLNEVWKKEIVSMLDLQKEIKVQLEKNYDW